MNYSESDSHHFNMFRMFVSHMALPVVRTVEYCRAVFAFVVLLVFHENQLTMVNEFYKSVYHSIGSVKQRFPHSINCFYDSIFRLKDCHPEELLISHVEDVPRCYYDVLL